MTFSRGSADFHGGRACPTRLLPLTVSTLIVSGSKDTDVPPVFALNYYTRAMLSRQE